MEKTEKKKKKTVPKKIVEDESSSRIRNILRVVTDRRAIGAAVLFVLVCAAVGSQLIGGFVYREGDIAESDIISPGTIEFEDTEATLAARAGAAGEFGEVYRLQPGFRNYIEDVFKTVLDAKSQPADAPGREKARKQLQDKGLSREASNRLFALEKDEPVRLRLHISTVLSRLAPEEMLDEKSLRRLEDDAMNMAAEEGISEDLLPAVAEVITKAVSLHSEKDPEATGDLRRRLEKSTAPVMRRVRKGEVIVRKGDAISGGHLDAMRAAGLAGPRSSWPKLAGFLLLQLFVFGVMGAFVKNTAPAVYRDADKMTIFYILVLLTVVSCVVVSSVELFSGYLLGAPPAALTILICVLLRPLPALAVVPALLLAVAPALGFEMSHFIVAVTAVLAAYFFTAGPQDRDSLLKAGVAVSLSNMAVILLLSLLGNVEWRRVFQDVLLFGALNGVIAAVTAMGSLPAFERGFNITTQHRLLELSNPEEPLLKQMLIHAPGTYYHSFFVGNLAETAAEALGANALLVRIACYYHDVGKLKRPYFFVENHIDGQKQLDDISPTLGALVISSHVKDGVEMAREHNLPDEIVDIIAQHHGNMLISFFYQQALAEAPEGKEVSEDRFRYPGRRPRTMEAAIIMVADSCEAAVRSIKDPTPKQIENTVNNIVEQRLFDKQFEECDITLKQIDTLRLTLVKTLASVYHTRMEYPDLEEMKAQREAGGKNGNGGNKEQNKG
ncbi:HD family phosphohydrolase [bacterium]